MGIKTQLLLYLVVVALADFDLMFSRSNGVEGTLPGVGKAINHSYGEKMFKGMLKGSVIDADLAMQGRKRIEELRKLQNDVEVIDAANPIVYTVKGTTLETYKVTPKFEFEPKTELAMVLNVEPSVTEDTTVGSEAGPGQVQERYSVPLDFNYLDTFHNNPDIYIPQRVGFGAFKYAGALFVGLVVKGPLDSFTYLDGLLTTTQLHVALHDLITTADAFHSNDTLIGIINIGNFLADFARKCVLLSHFGYVKMIKEEDGEKNPRMKEKIQIIEILVRKTPGGDKIIDFKEFCDWAKNDEIHPADTYLLNNSGETYHMDHTARLLLKKYLVTSDEMYNILDDHTLNSITCNRESAFNTFSFIEH